MNYFQLFDIPVSFLPDEQVIRQRYFALSKKYHPDFAATLPVAEQMLTLEHATAVNKAYQVLSHFDKRMQYILLEKGKIEIEGKFNLPPDFLMQMMELSEEAMALNMEPAPDRLRQFQEKIDNYDKQLLQGIQPKLKAWDNTSATESLLDDIRTYYYKRKYLQRIRSQVS